MAVTLQPAEQDEIKEAINLLNEKAALEKRFQENQRKLKFILKVRRVTALRMVVGANIVYLSENKTFVQVHVTPVDTTIPG